MLYDSGPMRLLEPFWTVALLGTLLSLWCLQQCMEWRTNRWSQPSSFGRRNCSAVGRVVPAENGAETNTVGSSTLLTKKTISLKQLNVQRTFKFLSISLLPSLNNLVSQAVFQSLTSKLCGLKHFCEV